MSDFEKWFNSDDCSVNPEGLTTEEIGIMRESYNAAIRQIGGAE